MRHRRGDRGDSGDKGFLDGGCYCIFMEENTGHGWCWRQLLQPKFNSWECVKKRGLLYTWCFTCQVMVRFKQIKKDALDNKALPEETNALLFLHLYLGPKIWTQVSSNISPRKEVPILRAGHTGAGLSWTPTHQPSQMLRQLLEQQNPAGVSNHNRAQRIFWSWELRKEMWANWCQEQESVHCPLSWGQRGAPGGL